MFAQIDIGSYLSDAIRIDLEATLRYARETNRQPRLLLVPVDDYMCVVNKIAEKFRMPFEPRLLNVPVSMTVDTEPRVLTVADDDTNLELRRSLCEFEVGN